MRTFDRVQGWLPWGVALCATMLVMPFIWPIVPLFLALSSLFLVALAGLARAVYRHHRAGDPYDLRALRELEDREEIRVLNEVEPEADADQALCIHCGEAYDSRLPFCPNCKRL